MLPTFTTYSQKHPRATVVFGLAVFTLGITLWSIVVTGVPQDAAYDAVVLGETRTEMTPEAEAMLVEKQIAELDTSSVAQVTDVQIEAELKALHEGGVHTEISEENLALQLEAMEQAKKSN